MKLDKKTFIRWKIYIDRSRMYIGYLQFFMIGVVFLEAFKTNFIVSTIFNYAIISMPILFLLFIGLSIIFGRLESKFKLQEEEQKKLTNLNPVMMEMLKDIKEIKESVKKLENEQ